ncbi:MAG: TonB-dependent receptor [Phenylobacterium sp.]|uniref:TonB-dependent receptor n=1 Tax=Phenylobacterium sp. TaxID=1871053 RepID=UPI0027358678|nr:TonB-dependent receptor [Phenylobacterium sp.]MDP3749547.1 TonB-dependent receptor [Phenylobacterium sp.]
MIAVLMSGAATSALAQAAADDTQLEEVIVTAQKRAENLQDVPISVSSFSERQVRDLGLEKPLDVGFQVPGLVAKSVNGDSSPLFTVRGIGVTDFTVGNNSPTSIYVDQVVKPYYPMVNFSLFDVSRIEVLKGPQGTLYGRNNTGGAIKFITRQPTFSNNGFLRADYGRFDTLELEGAWGGALSETVAVRVAGMTRQRGTGWQYDNFRKERNGEIDRLAGRVSLLWKPSEDFSATITAYAGRNRSDVPLFKLAPPFIPNPAGGTPPNRTITGVCAAALRGDRARDGSCVDSFGQFDPDPNNRHVSTNNVQGQGLREDGQGGVLTLEWSTGFADLTSVTGYDTQDRQEFQDFDGTPKIGTDNSFTQSFNAFSQELRIAAKEDSPIKWIGGLFYSKDKVENLQIIRSDDSFPGNGAVITNIDWLMRTESLAAFGQVEIPISSMLTAVGGLRYTEDTRSFVGGTTPRHAFFPTAVVNNKTSFDNFSGKVGLNFKPSEDLLIYASVSKGFKAGGFNGGFATTRFAYSPYGPETLYAYEFGIKSQPLPSLRLNAAAFFYNWKDFQATVTRVDPASGFPTQVLSNAGNAHIKGLEADLNWRPVAGLNIALSAAYTDPKIVSGIYEGRLIGNTPKYSLGGNLRYETPVESMGGSIYGFTDFSYRSRYALRLVTATTRPLVFQDAFWLANARIGYRTDDERIDVAAYVKNVFDNEYLVEVFDQGSLNTLDIYSEPRTYGVSLTYKF